MFPVHGHDRSAVLEADWSKVKWEYPTPGQNVARNRPWGNFSTGGSQGSSSGTGHNAAVSSFRAANRHSQHWVRAGRRGQQRHNPSTSSSASPPCQDALHSDAAQTCEALFQSAIPILNAPRLVAVFREFAPDP